MSPILKCLPLQTSSASRASRLDEILTSPSERRLSELAVLLDESNTIGSSLDPVGVPHDCKEDKTI